jgi:hypothetical protein
MFCIVLSTAKYNLYTSLEKPRIFRAPQGAVAGAAAERWGVFWIGGLSHTPNGEPNAPREVLRVGAARVTTTEREKVTLAAAR